jgi:hypothetical protein
LRTLTLALIAVTWIPGLAGTVHGLSPLRVWGVVCGYTGLSWALPGLLIYFLVDRLAKANRVTLHRPAAITAALLVGSVLLLGAATLIGT